jgi:aryl-alcohol dehydrogenase-like predicted oxidoreductase
MRRITLGGTGIETSCLGFGCASLGSRIGAEAGLAALRSAFEAGVTWFDLAPAYGRGEAEAIAGRFLRGRREAVQLATKVGLAPPAPGGLKAALMPLARAAIEALPPLRGALRRAGMGANRRLPLTPDLLHASLDASLRRLGTDRVELYALHNATPEDLRRDEILRALEAVLASGRARAVAVAADAATAEAALAAGAPFSVVQLPLPAPGAAAPVLSAAARAGFGTIVHSVFGIAGAGPALRPPADPEARARLLARAGTQTPEAALARLRLARAFALVPDGVVLASMFSDRSRAENLAVAARVPDPEAAAFLDRLARGREAGHEA